MSGQDLPGAWFFAGAGRSRTEQDGAGRSRDGAGRSRTEQDGAGRSRTEQDGAGRSRTEQDGALAFAANARLRRVVSIIALIAFVLLPKPPLYHIPGNRQARESAAICGALRARSAARAPTLPATAPPPPRSRGSSRSRGALPTMFRQYTTKARSGTAFPHHDAGPSPCETRSALNRARMSGASFTSQSGCNSASTVAQSSRAPMRSTMLSISAQSRERSANALGAALLGRPVCSISGMS